MRYLFVFLLAASSSFADCLFRVINYSLYPIQVQAGFFGGESASLHVSNSGINSILLKSDFKCIANSVNGDGVVYVNLVGGKSSGGWRYVPQNAMIRAMGVYTKSNGFVMGTNPTGVNVSLISNYKPESEVFEVQVNPAMFRDSKVSSFN